MTAARAGLPRIVLASDHGGVALKADLAAFLSGRGYPVADLGTDLDFGIAFKHREPQARWVHAEFFGQ